MSEQDRIAFDIIKLGIYAGGTFIHSGERIDHMFEGERTTCEHFLISVNELKSFADKFTAEANKRIAELEGGVANLHLNIKAQEQLGYEFKASNKHLREALELVDGHSKVWGFKIAGNVQAAINEALSATPAESLQAFKNELIEKCAKVATDACLVPPDGGTPMSYEVELCDAIAESIRVLKEVK